MAGDRAVQAHRGWGGRTLCIGAVWCAGAAASEFDAIFAHESARPAGECGPDYVGELAMSDVVKL